MSGSSFVTIYYLLSTPVAYTRAAADRLTRPPFPASSSPYFDYETVYSLPSSIHASQSATSRVVHPSPSTVHPFQSGDTLKEGCDIRQELINVISVVRLKGSKEENTTNRKGKAPRQFKQRDARLLDLDLGLYSSLLFDVRSVLILSIYLSSHHGKLTTSW